MPKAVAILPVVLAIYFPIAWHLESNYKPQEPGILRPPFAHYAGNAYLRYRASVGSKGDTSAEPERARLQLFEDGKPLGPAHTAPQDVSQLGAGRFAFFQVGEDRPALVFSTSDNSDPNTNGRTYRINDPSARDPYEEQRRR
ncbi:hypothetical protein [Bradyrhizobium sp. CCBAU 11361]|uniref:hypothetical protein n=1 Tax=Bradyrhizobium sp. CCBAU 11361 TaxID=1630812 RepID=UPI0023067ACF|nr:hypothetical protein [Bradyrhizobium sp. CCBAU 11361]